MTKYIGLIICLFLLMVIGSNEVASSSQCVAELSFWEAESECNKNNMSLPIATTYEDYTILEELIADYQYDDFWMGVYIPADEYQFKWLNNQTIQSYWDHDQPHEPDKKHCVVLDKDDYNWKTAACGDENYYICVDDTLSESTLYKVKVDYNTARMNCKSNGRDLVMIKTSDEQTNITNYLKSQGSIGYDIWIGLVGFGEDDKDFNKFQWIDGEKMTTVDGKGFHIKDKDKCVYYKGGEWKYDKNCVNDKKNYICFNAFTRQVTGSVEVVRSSQGDGERSFWDAEMECRNKNMSLPIAATYEEYAIFEEFIDKCITYDFWMGVNIPADEYQFKWLNNQTIQSFWDHDQPHEPDKKQCVVLYKDDYNWKTAACGDGNYYICVDYTLSESNFTLYQQQVNYTTARKKCIDSGMDLVMIKTADQQTKIKDYLKTPKGDDIWIGLVGFGEDNKDFNKFQWIDGEMMTTVDGKGFQIKTEDKCVYYKDGEWKYDKNCVNDKKNYICFNAFTRQVSVDEELSDYYDLIKNQKPASSTTPLIDTSFNRGALCAAECSKSYLCRMYTYNKSTHTCKTYKSAIHVTNNDPDLKFRLRRSV